MGTIPEKDNDRAREGKDILEPETAGLLLSQDGTLALAMVNQLLEKGTDVERLLPQLLTQIAKACGAERGFVLTFRPQADPDKTFKEGACQVEHCLNMSLRKSVVRFGIRSALAVPMKWDGHVRAVAYLDVVTGPNRFTMRDLELLKTFADRAAPALRNAFALRHSTRSVERLEAIVKHGLAELEFRNRYPEIIGESPRMKEVFRLLDRVREVDYPVVIEGETGTGKELVARAIHYGGNRKAGPFLPLNCGAIAETLLESELFGHVKGAFTGADAAKDGLFVLASGGTLFLDDIEVMPKSMQTKILRVLEEKLVRPVGGRDVVPVDARVVAASNVPLKELVAKGEFRDDLYYRLGVLRISLPPLRERVEDLSILVTHFTKVIKKETGLPDVTLDEGAMAAVHRYGWPGNIRQLQNELRRLAVSCRGKIGAADVEELLKKTKRLPATVEAPAQGRKKTASLGQQIDNYESLESAERRMIELALAKTGGNLSKAAQALKISRHALARRMKALGSIERRA
jgi:serine/threonine-protein kinase PknK